MEFINKSQSFAADEASTQTNNSKQSSKTRYGITDLIKQIKEEEIFFPLKFK